MDTFVKGENEMWKMPAKERIQTRIVSASAAKRVAGLSVCPAIHYRRFSFSFFSFMHLYSALLCIAVHPKHFTIMWRVSPQPPPVCSIHLDDATAATGQLKMFR